MWISEFLSSHNSTGRHPEHPSGLPLPGDWVRGVHRRAPVTLLEEGSGPS